MRVRHNDAENVEEIFCDCRRFLAKVKGGEVQIKCPVCKKWHVVDPERQDSKTFRNVSLAK